MYKRFFKRILDLTISTITLLLIGWGLLIIALLLNIMNKGTGAFFTQKRVGRDKMVFQMIKFKTMTDERDSEGKLLPDRLRLTKIGRFLRSTSIDELPQLINILKGDMSLIGPRPLYVRYLPYYDNEEIRRHEVRPGITGWAQVHGRKSISWTEKLRLDVEYVDTCSFWTDCKIIGLTIVKVLKREDIGLDTSGTNDFNEYREQEWSSYGLYDYIDKARNEIMNKKEVYEI